MVVARGEKVDADEEPRQCVDRIERPVLGFPYGLLPGVPKAGVPVKEFRKAWKAACEAAEKPEALFHDFRRTAVRNMIRAGVDRKVAMMISGHKTESVFNRYNITNDRDLEDAVRKTQEYVAKLPKERKAAVETDDKSQPE